MAKSKVFIIAGEASGDYLGGKLMSDLKTLHDDIEFVGIGGPSMASEGLQAIFSIDELSVIGIWEALKKFLSIQKKIDTTVKKITEYKPDVLITIDFPDFTSRVSKAIKSLDRSIPIVHYVAPSVWAWRADRAKELPKYVDKLLALWPFEPDFFTQYGLETVFVGHPVATDPDFSAPSDDAKNEFWNANFFTPPYPTDHDVWRASVQKWSDEQVTVKMCGNIEEKRRMAYRFSREEQAYEMSERFRYKLITLLPGSRKSELSNHMPILKEFAEMLAGRYEGVEQVRFIVPTIEPLKSDIEEYTDSWRIQPIVITSKCDKVLAMHMSDLAIAASGTVTLELARVGLPGVVIYKTSAITATIVKSAIKVKYVSLVNLLLDQPLLPELLQGDCKAENICMAAAELLDNHEKRDKQKIKFTEVINKLKPQDPQVAAKEVLKIIDKL